MLRKCFTMRLHPQLLIISEAYVFHHTQKASLTVAVWTLPLKPDLSLYSSLLPIHALG
jgi:hypothetical protein